MKDRVLSTYQGRDGISYHEKLVEVQSELLPLKFGETVQTSVSTREIISLGGTSESRRCNLN